MKQTSVHLNRWARLAGHHLGQLPVDARVGKPWNTLLPNHTGVQVPGAHAQVTTRGSCRWASGLANSVENLIK